VSQTGSYEGPSREATSSRILPKNETIRRSGGIVNAMSVDVEDYFQVSAFEKTVSRASWDTFESRVVRNTERLLDLFDRTGTKATFFVLGWVADRFPALVKTIASTGHEVASHGYHHQLVYMLTPDQFREDVRSAKAALESATGSAVVGFRAPSFSLVPSTLWALDILIEEGYQYDTSIFPIRHDRYGMPDAPRHIHTIDRPSGALLEMPMATVRLGHVNLPVSGGGYFRLLPYAWTRWGIRHMNFTDRQPALFYLHPWEIDPDQPRIAAGFATRLRHYTALSSTGPKLARLLREFEFDTVARVLNFSEHRTCSTYAEVS
jgi:polysaccharide deacetylase family protein (PEP-CTERM system associated)